MINGTPTILGQFSSSAASSNQYFCSRKFQWRTHFYYAGPRVHSTCSRTFATPSTVPASRTGISGCFKKFPITERTGFEFRAEAFDVNNQSQLECSQLQPDVRDVWKGNGENDPRSPTSSSTALLLLRGDRREHLRATSRLCGIGVTPVCPSARDAPGRDGPLLISDSLANSGYRTGLRCNGFELIWLNDAHFSSRSLRYVMVWRRGKRDRLEGLWSVPCRDLQTVYGDTYGAHEWHRRKFERAQFSKESGFTDSIRGTHFRLEQRPEGTVAHFSKGDAEADRRLDYFIGAGVVGRSYACDIDGFLFQSPIAHYSSAVQWDLSPGFEGRDRLALTRPIEPACLTCHASGLRIVAGTVNGYQKPVFAGSGVSCERCHGAGDVHVARMKSKTNLQGSGIVNPAKLNVAERDSICAQCHLTGEMRIAKTGKAAAYAVGGKFFDSTSVFLWSNGTHLPVANSHFEQLVESACWRRSDGNLWCGTCHDPHTTVSDSARASYYLASAVSRATLRRRAQAAAPLRNWRRAATDDCVSCHMQSESRDRLRTPALRPNGPYPLANSYQRPRGVPATGRVALIPCIPGSSAEHRELGLAYSGARLSRITIALGECAPSRCFAKRWQPLRMMRSRLSNWLSYMTARATRQQPVNFLARRYERTFRALARW